MANIQVSVWLNGTATNPFHKVGLTCNPFPALPDANPKFRALNHALRVLGSEPMPTVEDLKGKLTKLGAVPEFIELCVKHYRPGKITRFSIEFPE